MVDAETSTVIADIDEFDKYINYVKLQYASNREIVGIEIDNSTSSPTVKRIDRNGEQFTPESDFFHKHEIWGSMYLCTLTSEGVPTFKLLPNGSGLDLTGSSGDLMVRTPNIKCRYELDGTKQRIWAAPFDSNHPYYDYHPHCYSGGTLHSYFFGGAYEGSVGVDAFGNKILRSVSGAQPWTGGEIRSLAFTSGGPTAFTKGEQLTGSVSGATGYVVDSHVSSGTWEGGDAAGTVYLSLPGVAVATTTAFVNNDLLMISGVDRATATGAATILTLTMTNALTYAANKGTGWTITDIHADSLLKLLYFIQTGTRDSQTASGRGITNLVLGAGFGGKPTGSDNIDNLLDSWGNAKGDGTDGDVAISWNNYRNIWGNVWEWKSGINAFENGSCRVIKQDWAGPISAELAENSYDILSDSIPSTNAYISKIHTDYVGALAFLPSEVSGTSSTYFCDQLQKPSYNPSILSGGGAWTYNLINGINSTNFNGLNASYPNTGTRLKYIPQS
ncbi:MAG: hypothetical protein ABFC34_05305 [Methanobacterium sp.]